MSGFAERRFLRFVVLAGCFLVIPAFAQFEIAPDHFDGSSRQTTTPKASVKAKAKSTRQATAHPASVPPIASVATKRKQSPRAQQEIARRSKADIPPGSLPR
jgi:hypothetical protein